MRAMPVEFLTDDRGGYLDLDLLIRELTCWFVSLTVSSRQSAAEVSKLPERDGELVAEPVVVLAKLAVGVAQSPDDGLVGLGADPLLLRQRWAA